MHIFYCPEIQLPISTLNEDESHHCVKVLRLDIGSKIILLDGVGGLYEAEVLSNHAKKCAVKILTKTNQTKHSYYLHIAIAPTKSIERLEWFLEKCTEIGIDEITPLLCDRSERKNINIERLNKIIVAAAKQSVHAFFPKLNDFTKFNNFVNQILYGQKFIAHCEESEKKDLKNLYNKNGQATILIGPEGDFSDDEILLAKQNSFEEISLGDSRLRTETAGLVACHSISFINL